jgi:DNA invertase Pin-like site-specific DNA recombinase
MQELVTNIGTVGTAITSPPVVAVPIKYCLYARKSTEEDERQALSINSQIKEMLLVAQRENLTVIEIRRESHSAKASGQRLVYNQLIADIKIGKFDGILTWAPDRLSRNAGGLGAVVNLMDQKLLLEIRTFSQKFTNPPNKKYLLMILGSQAKLENDQRSINVKRGLRTRIEMGLWPGMAPTGYLNEYHKDRPCSVIPDPIRAPVVKQVFEKVAQGMSGRRVYLWLRDKVRFVTKNGKPFHLSNLYLLLRNSFYCGIIEYPRKSKKYYQGKHQPIITKELFDKTQATLDSELKPRTLGKEFAFTRLITCGICGSSISANEKFKNLKDGSVAKYIYYCCNKSKDRACPGNYIKEDLLVGELLKIIDQVDLDKLGIKQQIEQKLESYNKFRHLVLGQSQQEQLQQKILT